MKLNEFKFLKIKFCRDIAPLRQWNIYRRFEGTLLGPASGSNGSLLI